MYDITRIALNRAWCTGFGTIVRRENGPFVERFPETAGVNDHRRGIAGLFSFASRRRKD